MKLILLLALPLMAGNIFQQGYMIADSIIVGQGVGITALASLGASDWICWLFLWSIQGAANGFSVKIAETFGANDFRSLRKTIAMIVWLCIIIGLLLTLAGIWISHPLLTLMRTGPDIIEGSLLYIRTIYAGILAIFAYNMSSAILRCLGNSRAPLVAMIVASVVNVLLDILFVFVFHWGIFGAAFATVLAQGISFFFCLVVLWRNPLVCPQKADWSPDWPLLRELLGLGLPAAFQSGVIAIGGLVLQSVLNDCGTLFVAGFTATNKVYGVLESASISLGHVMVAYMGQNRGAKRIDRISQGIRWVTVIAFVLSTVIAAVMLLFGKNVLSLFVSTNEADTSAVIHIAYRYLTILCCPLMLLFCVNIYRSALQGLGNMHASVVSGFIEVFMRVAAALLLPLFIGQDGIFFAEAAAWGTAGIYMVLYYVTHIQGIQRSILHVPESGSK